MLPSANLESRPREPQLSTTSDKLPPRWNPLKHGLRSAAILLPDDDADEFQRLRQDLFHTYRPRTGEEAACVEAMASHHWRIARCRRWQAVYDAQTDALLFGDPNTPAGHICETDPHRWMHKSMDCVRQESRLDRLLCRARDKLLLLQKLRRNNQIAGAVEAGPDCMGMEYPIHGDGGAGRRPAGGGDLRPAAGGPDALTGRASASVDGAIGKYNERTPSPVSQPARMHEASACGGGAANTDGARCYPPAKEPTPQVSPALARGTGPALAGPGGVLRTAAERGGQTAISLPGDVRV